MIQLINELTARYGQPSRRTRPGGNQAVTQFKIDDEVATDHYPGFCRIWIHIPDDDKDAVMLELANAPHNSNVADLVREAGGQITASPIGAVISIRLPLHGAQFIRELARAIRRTTARGQRYLDPNWKWIAPRTADALERLAACLAVAARSRRAPAKT